MPILYNLITAHNGKPRYSRLTFCHACGSESIVLNKTPEGRNGFRHKHGLWQCMDCNASVSAHSDGNPQGYMANMQVRKLRYDFHKIMEVLINQKYTYADICNYIQARLDIDADHLHSAWLTTGELVMAIRAMEDRAKRPYKNRPYKTELRLKANASKQALRNKNFRLQREGQKQNAR